MSSTLSLIGSYFESRETSLTSITILPTLPPQHKQNFFENKTRPNKLWFFPSSHSYFYNFNSLISESETCEFEEYEKKKTMSIQEEENSSSPKIHIQTPPMATPAQGGGHQTPATGGIAGILRRWKREDLIKRGSLGLRGIAFLFSLISFIAMASNKHGDWKEFDRYEEYR